MKVENLEDLFYAQVSELKDVEERLIKALPKMAGAASSENLRRAFQDHLEQTKNHSRRLDQVFQDIGKKEDTKTSDAMKGLIDQGDDVVSHIEQSPLRDAGLISAGNRVEHFEIAAYGTLATMARLLGHNRSAQLLEQTLNEEKEADAKLTRIAEQTVNQEALQLGAHQQV
jgi:ferritin-like metal-binding protein YciE